LLIATLGAKIVLGLRELATLDSTAEYVSLVSALLVREGFSVTFDSPSEGFVWPVDANDGRCRLRLVPLAADGSTLEQVRLHVAYDARFFVVFRGRVYQDQPVFWTALFNVAPTVLNALGLSASRIPPLAVNANGECKIENLSWTVAASDDD
jgi:hypothetical protein